MDQKTTFYIVRHGETEFNVANIAQGHTDSPLTPKGREQAKLLGQVLKDVHFDVVFSSDLLRAKKTAELIVMEKKLAVNTSALLRERNYGKFDGGPGKVYREENKAIIEKMANMEWAERSKIKFADDIESDEEVSNRLITFLREAAVTYAGKTILIVSHGGIMRTFLIRTGWGTFKNLPGNSVQNTAYIKVATDGIDFDIQQVEGIDRQAVLS